MGNASCGVVTMGQHDTYDRSRDNLAFFERFSLEPVPPTAIEDRIATGARLETLDIPTYLDRQMVAETETGTALYRLIQLFGTPNVPRLAAGSDQRARSITTWQYLFQVTFNREDEDAPEEFLLSVYDYRTDVSTGLSAWQSTAKEESIPEPSADCEACSAISPPADEFLVGLVQLVLNMTEEPVPATFKELWI